MRWPYLRHVALEQHSLASCLANNVPEHFALAWGQDRYLCLDGRQIGVENAGQLGAQEARARRNAIPRSSRTYRFDFEMSANRPSSSDAECPYNESHPAQ